MVVEECYRRKAKKVVVDWNYQPLTRLHVRHQSLTTMSTLDNYEEARWQHYVDTIPCRIYLDIRQTRTVLAASIRRRWPRHSRKNIRSSRATATRSRTNTSGASPPSPARSGPRSSSRSCGPARPWKSSGRPSCSTSRVMDRPRRRLAGAQQGSARSRCDYLNRPWHPLSCTTRASNGTDLPCRHDPRGRSFCGGGRDEPAGHLLQPEHPVRGDVSSPRSAASPRALSSSSKPLCYQGQLIRPVLDSLPRGQGRRMGARRKTKRCSRSSSPWTRAAPTSANARSCRSTLPINADRHPVLQYAVRRERLPAIWRSAWALPIRCDGFEHNRRSRSAARSA